MDRNQALVDEFQSTLEMWKGKQVNTTGFNERADRTIDQVKELMVELRRSDVPNNWTQSYGLYMQALETYNAYFEKAKEYVNYASTDNSDPAHRESLQSSMSDLLSKAHGLSQQSKSVMP